MYAHRSPDIDIRKRSMQGFCGHRRRLDACGQNEEAHCCAPMPELSCRGAGHTGENRPSLVKRHRHVVPLRRTPHYFWPDRPRSHRSCRLVRLVDDATGA